MNGHQSQVSRISSKFLPAHGPRQPYRTQAQAHLGASAGGSTVRHHGGSPGRGLCPCIIRKQFFRSARLVLNRVRPSGGRYNLCPAKHRQKLSTRSDRLVPCAHNCPFLQGSTSTQQQRSARSPTASSKRPRIPLAEAQNVTGHRQTPENCPPRQAFVPTNRDHSPGDPKNEATQNSGEAGVRRLRRAIQMRCVRLL
jgi:hypothetical protein